MHSWGIWVGILKLIPAFQFIRLIVFSKYCFQEIEIIKPIFTYRKLNMKKYALCIASLVFSFSVFAQDAGEVGGVARAGAQTPKDIGAIQTGIGGLQGHSVPPSAEKGAVNTVTNTGNQSVNTVSNTGSGISNSLWGGGAVGGGPVAISNSGNSIGSGIVNTGNQVGSGIENTGNQAGSGIESVGNSIGSAF